MFVISGISNIVNPDLDNHSTSSYINKSSATSYKTETTTKDNSDEKNAVSTNSYKTETTTKDNSDEKTTISNKVEESKTSNKIDNKNNDVENKTNVVSLEIEKKDSNVEILTVKTNPANNFDTYTDTKVDSVYVGNIQTKKFHKQSCKYVKKMNPSNVVKFSSREEAIKAVYEPCKVCNL